MELTEQELKSLRECPASGIAFPEPGNRTAYVKQRLFDNKYVTTLWVRDDANDEVFFTWARTPLGDIAVEEAYKPKRALSPHGSALDERRKQQ